MIVDENLNETYSNLSYRKKLENKEFELSSNKNNYIIYNFNNIKSRPNS